MQRNRWDGLCSKPRQNRSVERVISHTAPAVCPTSTSSQQGGLSIRPSIRSMLPPPPSTSSCSPRPNVCPIPVDKNKLLLKAAEKGCEEDVQKLLDEGVDVNTVSASGWTALHFAAMRGHARVINLLIERGANINFRGPHKFTALHLATFKDSSGCSVRLLIDAGAQLENRNQSGRTPLHYAAECTNEAAVRELLAAGANTSALTYDRLKPKDLTSSNSIRELLS